MSEKQDRQGVRTATDLERKYQFDKRFAEILGVALDAQASIVRLGSTVADNITNMHTSLTRDATQIVMEALKSYVTSDALSEYETTVRTRFETTAEALKGYATQESLNKVTGELETITKYFTFDINGMTVGNVDNPNKVVIDDDEIMIKVNDRIVQHFKVDGSALIPILNVTESVNLLGLLLKDNGTTIDLEYGG